MQQDDQDQDQHRVDLSHVSQLNNTSIIDVLAHLQPHPQNLIDGEQDVDVEHVLLQQQVHNLLQSRTTEELRHLVGRLKGQDPPDPVGYSHIHAFDPVEVYIDPNLHDLESAQGGSATATGTRSRKRKGGTERDGEDAGSTTRNKVGKGRKKRSTGVSEETGKRVENRRKVELGVSRAPGSLHIWDTRY
jgi:hypothetical protein